MLCCAVLVSEKILSGIICCGLNRTLPSIFSYQLSHRLREAQEGMEKELMTELESKAQIFCLFSTEKEARSRERGGLDKSMKFMFLKKFQLSAGSCFPVAEMGQLSEFAPNPCKREVIWGLSVPSSVVS